MNWPFNRNLIRVRELIAADDLHAASVLARETGCLGGWWGQFTSGTLIKKLVARSAKATAAGEYEAAWQDINDAVLLNRGSHSDLLAREQTRLIEATVEHAERCLREGQFAEAVHVVTPPARRRIQDRRIDLIARVCGLAVEARSLAEKGKWRESTAMLEEARALRPDLPFLHSRIEVNRQQEAVVRSLSDQLCKALTVSDWNGVNQLSGQILSVAPAYQIALDARQRWESHYSGPAPVRPVHESSAEAISTDTVREPGGNETHRLFPERKPMVSEAPPSGLSRSSPESSCEVSPRSFMLWIDGVGGFLVCTGREVVIGRAAPQPDADIPVHADIRRRQMVIRRARDGFIATPFEPGPGSAPGILRDGEEIDAGGGLRLRVSQPVTLGNSLRINLASRHRTDPWSDAILLLGDAILLGNSPKNHVASPRLSGDILLYRRGQNVYLRVPGEYEIDGVAGEGDIRVDRGFRLVGGTFSATVELIAAVERCSG